jgi:hypothetical protein|eukprot:evm.model.NODE_27649_length_8407_cov_13.565362.1
MLGEAEITPILARLLYKYEKQGVKYTKFEERQANLWWMAATKGSFRILRPATSKATLSLPSIPPGLAPQRPRE